MKITVNAGKASINSPFNPEFVSRIKSIGGRWDAASKTWTVGENMLTEAREIMRAVYGRDDQQTDVQVTDIRIRFNEEVHCTVGGITMYGKTIAKAWGRDSGARVGDDVAFVEGRPDSGGSAKNWRTIIPEGSVVVIKNVPVSLLGEPLPEGAEIVTEADTRKAALLARKAELEAALAAINDELGRI